MILLLQTEVLYLVIKCDYVLVCALFGGLQQFCDKFQVVIRLCLCY
jgi:low affinity Fe/Cu permease